MLYLHGEHSCRTCRATAEGLRELFAYPSVLLTPSPLIVKGGNVQRWNGHTFEPHAQDALRGVHAVSAGGREVWGVQMNERGVSAVRLASDLSVLGRATAKALQPGAQCALAFAGDTSCCWVAGRSVATSTGTPGKLSEVFKLPKGRKLALLGFGAEGFTFLGETGGGVVRFDLEGTVVFDSSPRPARGGQEDVEGD